MRPETLHRNAVFRDPTHPAGDEPTCPACTVAATTYPPAPPVRTEVHDGLEFEIPTWDPAPTPWNPAGSWAVDPELEARLRAGILEAIPDFGQRVAEAIRDAVAVPASEWCGTFWGSHGCGRVKGHSGLCVCDPGGYTRSSKVCSVLMKYGGSDTGIVAWNGETAPSVHHWRWFE